MSERHFRRLREPMRSGGAEGIVDRRRGRASAPGAGVDEIAWVMEEFRTRYFDFTAKHFHEAIQGRCDGSFSGLHLDQERAAVPWARQKGAEALGPPQEAGAPALAGDAGVPGRLATCLAGRAPELDLIVTMDDATSAILSAVLVEEEGTASSFVGLKEVIGARPVFGPLHRPRQPLLSHAHGWRAGGQDPPHPGRAGAQRARHRAHPELLPGGPRAHGAAVRHAPEPAAAADAPGGARLDRGRQPTGSRPYIRATTPVSRSRPPRKGRRSCRSWGRSTISCAPGGARGGERQHGALRGSRAADP